METRIVKLSFSGPVHFGRGRLSDSGYTFDAGTLFSALYIEALHNGIQDELLDAVRSGALAISDAFPYIGKTLYLPKPILPPELVGQSAMDRDAAGERQDSRERKAHKKLAYVPATGYAEYLSGRFDALAELGRFDLGRSYLQTKVNLTHEDGEDSLPYFVGGYLFAPDAGVYFLIDGTCDVDSLLEQLSYAGIGGKRSSGYGRFSYQMGVAELPGKLVGPDVLGNSSGLSVLMASAAPRADELDDDLLEGARYRLLRRGGFVQSMTHAASPQKRRDLYVFAAGSTFARRFGGDVYDLNASSGAHPVYRYAKSLWLEV